MNVIADFHVESPELLLSGALAADPEIRIIVEQHTANESGLPIFFFWARGEDFDTFEAAMEADGTVGTADVIDEAGGQKLYRVEFAVPSFYPKYRETAAKIIDLRGTHEGWSIRMRFPSQDAFREYRSYYDEAGVSFRLDRITTKEGAASEDQYGLTPVQYETLLLAYERGYFDDPRLVSLAELADELDVSAQAVAGRLRRGHANLLANTIAAGWRPDTLKDMA